MLCAGPHFDLVLTLGEMLFSDFWHENDSSISWSGRYSCLHMLQLLATCKLCVTALSLQEEQFAAYRNFETHECHMGVP